MIITEFYRRRKDGIKLMVTYSTEGYYIKKENEDFLRTKSIDAYPVRFKYIETDILIPVKEEKKVEETIKEE